MPTKVCAYGAPRAPDQCLPLPPSSSSSSSSPRPSRHKVGTDLICPSRYKGLAKSDRYREDIAKLEDVYALNPMYRVCTGCVHPESSRDCYKSAGAFPRIFIIQGRSQRQSRTASDRLYGCRFLSGREHSTATTCCHPFSCKRSARSLSPLFLLLSLALFIHSPSLSPLSVQDPIWREHGWKVFQAFERCCKVIRHPVPAPFTPVVTLCPRRCDSFRYCSSYEETPPVHEARCKEAAGAACPPAPRGAFLQGRRECEERGLLPARL